MEDKLKAIFDRAATMTEGFLVITIVPWFTDSPNLGKVDDIPAVAWAPCCSLHTIAWIFAPGVFRLSSVTQTHCLFCGWPSWAALRRESGFLCRHVKPHINDQGEKAK